SGSHSSQPRRTATLQSGRHAAPAGEEDAPPAAARRRRWPLMTSIIALFVILVGGGAFIAHQVINSQYYVGIRGSKVVIFRGLDQKLLGFSLSNVYRRTSIPASGITSTSRDAIRHAPSGNLAQANHFIANIRAGYNNCQAAYAAVTTWQDHKPKPQPIISKKTGKVIGHTHPKYRPKPPIPTDCPQMPTHGT